MAHVSVHSSRESIVLLAMHNSPVEKMGSFRATPTNHDDPNTVFPPIVYL